MSTETQNQQKTNPEHKEEQNEKSLMDKVTENAKWAYEKTGEALGDIKDTVVGGQSEEKASNKVLKEGNEAIKEINKEYDMPGKHNELKGVQEDKGYVGGHPRKD